jgi:hypothetical protein
MQRRKSVEWRDLNSKFSFHSFALYIKGRQQPKRAATPAEVVGSNLTIFIFIDLDNYGIELK